MSAPPPASTPASAFTEQVAAEQQVAPAILADKIDPDTGDFLSIVEGWGIVDGAVIHAMRVERGTGASVRETGNRFKTVRHVEEQNAELLESLAEEALRPLIDQGMARLDGFAAETEEGDGTQQNTELQYVDLVTAKPNKRSFTVPRRVE